MARRRGRYLLWGVLAWLPMPVLAVLNAVLRELVLQPAFGPEVAQPASGLTLIAILALYSLTVFRWILGAAHTTTAWLLGAIWAALTLAFEYALIAAGNDQPFAALIDTISPQTLAQGNLFALAVLFVLLAPPLFTRRAG